MTDTGHLDMNQPMSPETRLAVLAEQMGHLVEKVDTVARQQEVVITTVRSLAVHEEKLETMGDKLVSLEDRTAKVEIAIQKQEQVISAARGSIKLANWFWGIGCTMIVCIAGWTFRGISDSHDENIRQDERLKVIEKHIDQISEQVRKEPR